MNKEPNGRAQVERRVRPEPIDARIRSALGGRTSAQYHELMAMVFPEEKYPRAFERSANGGPPGCAIAFNAALRRMGGYWRGMGSARMVYVPNAKLTSPPHDGLSTREDL